MLNFLCCYYNNACSVVKVSCCNFNFCYLHSNFVVVNVTCSNSIYDFM